MNTESSFKFQFKKHRISQVQFSRREQDVSMREGIIVILKRSSERLNLHQTKLDSVSHYH